MEQGSGPSPATVQQSDSLAPAPAKSPPPGVAPARRQACAATALWALLTVAVGVWFCRAQRSALRQDAEDQLDAVARLQVAQLANWRRERLADAVLVRQTPYAARRALDALSEPRSQTTRGMFVAWLQPLLAKGPYREAMVLDADLNVCLVHPGASVGALVEAERVAAAEALRTRDVAVADLHQSADGSSVVLSLMVPLVVRREGSREAVPAAGRGSAADHSAGVLVLQCDARDTLFPMLASWPLPAESAETVLLRPEGDEALVLNSLRHRQDAALKLSLPLARAGSPEASAARGRQGVVQGPDYRGVEVLAMRRRVPGSPWCIVSKLDAQEAFAAMRARSALVLLMTGGFALLGAATAALVWQRSAKVHYRALFEAEEEAAARARQQAVIADLGQLAVRGTSLPELLAEATRCVGQALGAETCEILELLPGQAELALRAGVGWPDGLAGPAAVAAGNESLAGYVVQTKVPVVAHDLRTDPRFRTPQPLLDRGVASGLGTLIGDPGRPHGVLSAHAVRPREFTQRDVHFLQAAAKLLGDAIEHHLSAAAVRQRAEELARLNLELTESRRATLGLIEDATAARRRAEEANAALRHEVEERRRTADALRVSLEEKLVLLKEVHHRVKNNLQIVASLLTLQAARTCGQTQAAAVLHDTCNRVHAMALLHEILYRSPNLARLSFQTYVRELCGHLLRSHGRAETATIQHRVLRVGLPIEQAVPCGLIISELVANALKHGLAEGGTGSVTVEFQQAAEGQFVLRVSDDGAGLPPDLDVAALATLGLHLVASLAGQLGGRLVIERPAAGGAALAVFFPVPHGTFIESGT